MDVSDPHFIDDPHSAVVNAVELWRIGLALQGAIRKGSITPASFPPRIVLDFGDNTGMPITTTFDSKRQLEDAMHNIQLSTLAIAAVATDSALDAHFKKTDPSKGRPLDKGDKRTMSDLASIDALRALLYMIRNAFAHDPFNPKWEMRSATRRGRLRIPELGIDLDTSSLDGRPLNADIWGGSWGFLRILQEAEKITRPDGWDPESLKDRYKDKA
jgi:hypothetical protein